MCLNVAAYAAVLSALRGGSPEAVVKLGGDVGEGGGIIIISAWQRGTRA